MTLYMLSLLFMKYALLSFGGGYVLMPLLLEDMVQKYQLISTDVFTQLISLAQITPGPIGINTATYVGFSQFGIWGGIIASISLVVPSFLLVIIASKFLKRYQDTIFVQGIFAGMRPASLAMICIAIILFIEVSITTTQFPFLTYLQELVASKTHPHNIDFAVRWVPLCICVATIIFQLKTKVNFLLLMLIAGIIGAVFC